MGTPGGATDLSIVPAEVTKLGKFAYDLADVLRSALSTAGRKVDTVTTNSWKSPAAQSFAAGWSDCSDGGHKIIDALADMAEALGVTAATYGAQDNQFAADVSSLNLPPIEGPRLRPAAPTNASLLDLPES
ncbi:WXG100 family type VII secretion target [Nocardia stercoris]|uniref:WXG100 family type VII secretion target n=1 Tax=Nocardia stercoris TaxID=2483361 RepID=A0A3M2L014_9NOCA|nr:type VII secretion target [Nocardia stercoris]RMI29853.1 WXG100 family type VII secretion target [Nocardia stercoris]